MKANFACSTCLVCFGHAHSALQAFLLCFFCRVEKEKNMHVSGCIILAAAVSNRASDVCMLYKFTCHREYIITFASYFALIKFTMGKNWMCQRGIYVCEWVFAFTTQFTFLYFISLHCVLSHLRVGCASFSLHLSRDVAIRSFCISLKQTRMQLHTFGGKNALLATSDVMDFMLVCIF